MNLTLGIIISCVLALVCARWYESNKLFWILFTSLMVGIVGGSIYAHSKDDTCKNETFKKFEVLKDSVNNANCDTVSPFGDVFVTYVPNSTPTESYFNDIEHSFVLTNGHANIITQPPRFNHFRLCTIDSTTHHDSEAL